MSDPPRVWIPFPLPKGRWYANLILAHHQYQMPLSNRESVHHKWCKLTRVTNEPFRGRSFLGCRKFRRTRALKDTNHGIMHVAASCGWFQNCFHWLRSKASSSLSMIWLCFIPESKLVPTEGVRGRCGLGLHETCWACGIQEHVRFPLRYFACPALHRRLEKWAT